MSQENQTPNFKEDFTFSKHWSTIERAHHAMTHFPERAADRIVKDYSEEFDQDLKELGEKQGKYAEKYERYLLDWVDAKSRCLNWFITGPANFPVRKAEKANNSERNKYEAFRAWRKKYFKAVNRVRTKSPEEDLEIKMRQVNEAIIRNENIKEHNKVIRKYKSGKITKEEMYEQLQAQGLSDQLKKDLEQFIDEAWFRQFSTIAPEIKRLKEMAIAFQARIEAKASWEDITFSDEKYSGRIALEDDRIKIFHDEKPDKERLKAMNDRGFNWSPNWRAHVRKHTRQAIVDAKRIVGVPL